VAAPFEADFASRGLSCTQLRSVYGEGNYRNPYGNLIEQALG
jgi:hypothetical protein